MSLTTWHTRLALILSTAALAACEVPAAGSPDADGTEVVRSDLHVYRIATVVEGLENPWSIAFLPEGDMLVTERPGRLRHVRGGELVEEPVPGLPEIRVGGQGGLLDVVPHPDFASNRLVYISYSKPNEDDSEGTTAVIRARFEEGALQDVEEIFEAQAWSQGRGHHGSRLAFDHDGYLFVTVGDRQARPAGDLEAHPAQDPSNHFGTISRLHDDGGIPEDNPFVDDPDALPSIWSYGHRNPQGLAVHPETGEVWANEHGPQGGDELNLIRPGENYGWPVVGFGVNYGSGEPIHDAVRAEGMVNPVHQWVPSIATSGLMIYDGYAFPAWQGHIFNGGLAGQRLDRVALDEDHRYRSEEVVVRDLGRIRDVRQGPDGYVYLAIDGVPQEDDPGRSIVRLEPQ